MTTYALALPLALFAMACNKTSPASPNPSSPLGAPALDAPSVDQQLETLRPTLTIVNPAASGGGARTYEFQLSTNDTFTPLTTSRSGIAENSTGRTSYVSEQDLPSATRVFWRARVTQGTSNAEWSLTGRFRTKAVGFNTTTALFDPLTNGETVGTLNGNTTWLPGKGLRLNDRFSYVRYLLPRTLTAGEISVEVEGLRPDGPGGKPKIFHMAENLDRASTNPYMINAQYRGSGVPEGCAAPPGGNPSNSIAFKAVLGGFAPTFVVEPDLAKRNQFVFMPDPSRTYFWQGIWAMRTFRLVVKADGSSGPSIYDYEMTAPTGNGFSASQHYVFIGTNYDEFGCGAGTFPGMIVRNVWVSDRARPASLGSSVRATP